ncbi:UDP-N-acetylmuramoyl-L-alanine--D-glutamate ligase [Bdellovibrio sp. ArHS]|uniref:UDP-N-acetylmuramoyl-L-alanine--D-glutamate ligase n=1 Tax=Bdellovibrio sp. ArHS TaxID=1569284 RepID=UPI0025BFD926|nr:UDP-N-acetylmuramoyl-L-alanine--D-glutamate ligase [Bdellovibrio sp. ArHS]
MQMNEFIKNLKTPIAIVGMGKSGEAARRLLLNLGFSPESVLTFDGKLQTADYNDPDALMSNAAPKTLVVSPGVPLTSAWIQNAQKNGVKITSEISLACACLEGEKLIGVTGSVGKSTTVSLMGAGLEAFSKTGFVGGNLGTPFAQYSAEVLEGKRPRADWIILELSSYQLENCENLALDYSAITYFTSNHLERYNNLEHYYQTKWHILSLTKNALFLNSEGGDLVEYSKKRDAENVKIVSKEDPVLKGLHLEKAELIGQHNQDNIALASALAIEAGWPSAAVDGMKRFKGLAHRLENVGTFKGVRFINDSKATAMDSVLIASAAAYDTLSNGGKLYLLLGGRDKNLPWQDLLPLKHFQSIEFVFFGECREIAQQKSSLPGSSYSHLNEALQHCFQRAKDSDTVLLSPGGTSLDEFKSFEDRGNFFKSKVAEFAQR